MSLDPLPALAIFFLLAHLISTPGMLSGCVAAFQLSWLCNERGEQH